MKKKKMGLAFLCALSALILGGLSACGLSSGDSIPSGSSQASENGSSSTYSAEESSSIMESGEEASSSIEENSSVEDSSNEDSSSEDSSSVEENSSEDSSSEEDGSGIRKEIDSLGHEIAYYPDGTWEDLGRVEPLDFTPRAAAERLGYQAFMKDKRAGVLCSLYMDLYNGAAAFANSNKNVSDTDGYYPIAGIKYTDYKNITTEELVMVWKAVLQDCPEFYYLGTSCYVDSKGYFYLCINEEYAKAADRQAVKSALEAAALECDQYLNGMMSEAERAVTIYDYLVANMEYVYEADGVTPSGELWAHNLVGWATRGEGVCETYAEAYTYLCSLFGLESSMVVGVAGQTADDTESHAWNIVKIDDVWYTVDATWGDVTETLVDRQWFGKPIDEFVKTHVADEPVIGEKYQFPMPELSNEPISPVFLIENEGASEMVLSIDEAFKKMTNSGGMYEIKVYPETKVLQEKGVFVCPVGAEIYTALPSVAQLTISADQKITTQDSDKILLNVCIAAKKPIVLLGAVVLEDVQVYTESLEKGDYELMLVGTAKTHLGTNEAPSDLSGTIVEEQTDGKKAKAEACFIERRYRF